MMFELNWFRAVPAGLKRVVYSLDSVHAESGQLVGKSCGLVIERLRVRIPEGAAGEFSSPGCYLFHAERDKRQL